MPKFDIKKNDFVLVFNLRKMEIVSSTINMFAFMSFQLLQLYTAVNDSDLDLNLEVYCEKNNKEN